MLSPVIPPTVAGVAVIVLLVFLTSIATLVARPDTVNTLGRHEHRSPALRQPLFEDEPDFEPIPEADPGPEEPDFEDEDPELVPVAVPEPIDELDPRWDWRAYADRELVDA